MAALVLDVVLVSASALIYLDSVYLVGVELPLLAVWLPLHLVHHVDLLLLNAIESSWGVVEPGARPGLEPRGARGDFSFQDIVDALLESLRVLILIIAGLRAHLVLHLQDLLLVAYAPTDVLDHASVRTHVGEQFPGRIANDPLLVRILLQILQVLLIHDMVHHVATPIVAWDVDLA